eukprot:1153724-Pelagomonas_calceolata.AAC.3
MLQEGMSAGGNSRGPQPSILALCPELWQCGLPLGPASPGALFCHKKQSLLWASSLVAGMKTAHFTNMKAALATCACMRAGLVHGGMQKWCLHPSMNKRCLHVCMYEGITCHLNEGSRCVSAPGHPGMQHQTPAHHPHCHRLHHSA